MKKVFYVVLFTLMMVFALIGCASPASLSDINVEYAAMLHEPASPESISDIGAFLDQNLSKFDEHHADQMVIAFEDYIFAFDRNSPDYMEFLERFEEYISSALTGLYEIKIEEQENPAVIDNILQKSWPQLCERSLSLELFIRQTNHQIVQEEAARIYEHYIRLMLMGVTGTPVFDDGGNFKEDVLHALVEFEVLYPDTAVSGALREFIAYLAGIDFRIDFENIEENKAFSDMCSHLVSEAGKRVLH